MTQNHTYFLTWLWLTCTLVVCQLGYVLEVLAQMFVFEEMNHRKWLRIAWLQESAGVTRFEGDNGKPMLHTQFCLVVVEIGQLGIPCQSGRYGVFATVQIYPSSVLHGSLPAYPS